MLDKNSADTHPHTVFRYIMIGFGLADAAGSVVIGALSDKLGRAPVLALGFVLQGSVALALLFWVPEKSNYGPPIVMALLLGVGDSVGQVVPAALCSAAFAPSEVLVADDGGVISSYRTVNMKPFFLLF